MYYLCSFRGSPEKVIDDANRLKLRKEWLRAGDKYLKAAGLYRHNTDKEYETSRSLSDAANCFMKVDSRYSVLALEAAAVIHAQLGQFNFAAGLHKNIAELAQDFERKAPGCTDWQTVRGEPLDSKRSGRIESLNSMPRTPKEMSAQELALWHYKRAADYYQGENSPANEADCLTKRAEILADIRKLGEAAEEFEKLAKQAEEHEFLGAKNHAFRACLCRLANRQDPSVDAMEKICPSFAGSDESDFVRGLTEAADSTSIAKAQGRFERFNTLDDWSKKRLADVRKVKAGPTLV